MSSTNPNNNTQQRIFLKNQKYFPCTLFKICKNVISLFSEITYIQDKRNME